MATKKLDIELRVQTKGSVLSWEVFLEKTDKAYRVESGWKYDIEDKSFYVELENYPVIDNALDVFVGCEGKIGGAMACTVIINTHKQDERVTCRNEDKNYGHIAYTL